MGRHGERHGGERYGGTDTAGRPPDVPAAGRSGRGRRTRNRSRATALLAVGVAALAMALAMCGFPPESGSSGAGSGASPAAQVGWGFTHTEYSADRGDAAATHSASRLLSAEPMPQNQHIMGWGAQNPEPSPGKYDFTELDSRVDLIRRTGGTPVLTLCCAPDWMKGGKAGETDWGALEKAPDPEHYADFAELAGTIARRYPDIRHFIVWNELKGFYDEARNRWDHEGYTRLYNLVYKELKKIDKNNLVGGPYTVMDSHPPGDDSYASDVKGPWGSLDQRTVDAVEYWNEHKAGADFVVVDGSSYTKDDQYVPDAFAATRKFADVGRWLRETTGLPLWWAEWYVEVADRNDDRNGWSEPRRTATQASALISMTEGGATSGFYWNPQNEGADCPGCLWRSTQLRDGGGELPMMDLLSRFSRAFPPGTSFVPVDVAAGDRANLRVLADRRTLMVVNTLDRPVRTTVDGRSLTLDPYEIRWEKRS
ncbi:xylan 1,4-beta-xylosidase [Streptomyces albofaciens JCM 4342]|uniref:GH39 family glycosyl hydrolase n=1 Tax=Streptomyces albofaciens TaxID=66866 RepID=UPI0012385D41|nr:xylan 1,4-beta-xylosidase [Streptomyces albofaciens]KAA6222765.1 xylan 1,4-beta-xylosidase [Streptomyces albofaciens JCM 4342]